MTALLLECVRCGARIRCVWCEAAAKPMLCITCFEKVAGVGAAGICDWFDA